MEPMGRAHIGFWVRFRHITGFLVIFVEAGYRDPQDAILSSPERQKETGTESGFAFRAIVTEPS